MFLCRVQVVAYGDGFWSWVFKKIKNCVVFQPMSVDELRESLKRACKTVHAARKVLYCYEMKLQQAVDDINYIESRTRGFFAGLVEEMMGSDAD